MKAASRESEVKVQTTQQTALQESEAKMQSTLQATHDRIDARFRNQQRHHDEGMQALYDQMTTFRQGGQQPFTRWEGETPEHNSEETSWSQVPTSARTGTRERTTCSEWARGSRRSLEGPRRDHYGRTKNYHSMPFEEVPPPPLREDLKEHIGGFHPFTAKVMNVKLPSKW